MATGFMGSSTQCVAACASESGMTSNSALRDIRLGRARTIQPRRTLRCGRRACTRGTCNAVWDGERGVTRAMRAEEKEGRAACSESEVKQAKGQSKVYNFRGGRSSWALETLGGRKDRRMRPSRRVKSIKDIASGGSDPGARTCAVGGRVKARRAGKRSTEALEAVEERGDACGECTYRGDSRNDGRDSPLDLRPDDLYQWARGRARRAIAPVTLLSIRLGHAQVVELSREACCARGPHSCRVRVEGPGKSGRQGGEPLPIFYRTKRGYLTGNLKYTNILPAAENCKFGATYGVI
ncbi:hypothetical protein HYPSUDRAFT_59016 [Hypholoma sublateritium FD-334 SS-4]|uniref:Uncharacterized protein n=1 Tax=Hypholoma sublateritium (strain FD-334 SS-4) TaxID=945553 RepID=A0A0D2KK68_HYPSF|nr:hypothetical protein HYPSUDRAFT_59016 [Hypholoma sublateritium FD-334 SS-4]